MELAELSFQNTNNNQEIVRESDLSVERQNIRESVVLEDPCKRAALAAHMSELPTPTTVSTSCKQSNL